MVKDTIDPDPKYVSHHPKVQSILLWLFQSQDDPKIQKRLEFLPIFLGGPMGPYSPGLGMLMLTSSVPLTRTLQLRKL